MPTFGQGLPRLPMSKNIQIFFVFCQLSRFPKILKPEFQLQPTVPPSAKQRVGSYLPWKQFVKQNMQHFFAAF